MKTNFFFRGHCLPLFFLLATSLLGQYLNSAQAQEDGAYQVADRGANHRIWQRVTRTTNEIGQVQSRTNSYTELASGLHYWRGGAWHESVPSIGVTTDGATATNGAHQVCFEGNAHCMTAIDLAMPGGGHLQSHVTGLVYYDTATGQNTMIAELKDCSGEICASNQAVYADAFTDFKADLRYTYTKDGFEQDIILREQLDSPTNYGFAAETTRLEVWTEFTNPPPPIIQTNLLQDGTPTETLSFGAMRMGLGKAFSLGETNSPSGGTQVQKAWRTIDGRTFLIESVPYPAIQPQMLALPQLAPHASLKVPRGSPSKSASLLHPPKLHASAGFKPMTIAQARPAEPGYVIDYAITLGGTNFTNYVFKGDTTYYISSALSLYGTVTFEGGTVIKFNSSGSPILNLRDGLVHCQTDQYHPAIFTVKNDNSVGETVSGSTGNTSTRFYEGVDIQAGLPVLNNIRFSHGTWPLNLRSGMTGLELRNVQWVDCEVPVESDGVNFNMRNALIAKANNPIMGTTYAASLENVTIDHVLYSMTGVWGGPDGSTIALTNCIAVALSAIGDAVTNADHSVVETDTLPGIFQTVGAGSYYLADGSLYRDAGTTNVDATLLSDLHKRTTYPPLVYSNAIIPTMTFTPQAQRDIDTIDLGYHYDPLDFVFYQAVATNAILTISPGTAIGYAYASSLHRGLYENNNVSLISEGTATAHNVFALYNTVQEQTTTNWAINPGGYAILPSTFGTSTNRFRFTDFSTLAQDSYHYYDISAGNASTPLRDCQFYGGFFFETASSITVTNCLFDRVNADFEDNFDGSVTTKLVNNLFHGGTLGLYRFDVGDWVVKDNLFDRTALTWADDSFSNGDNAYVTSTNKLANTFGTDVILTNSPAYQTSFMGRYYYPTNLPLINAGGQSATNAGLYHYTTTTNQWKETNSIVDIGFHYVATDTNGIPIDTDGDGLADYLEDTNGNGVYDTPDVSNWNLADTDGDGVDDYTEILEGRDPKVADTLNGAVRLQVYHPIK